LTIADCPGLLPGASEDVGLGHTFLRHIERSQVLVYVVDLTSKSPELDLRVLREELDAYTPELSKRAKIIVANKADKIDSEDPEAVEAIKGRLDALRRIAMEWQESDGIARTVLPMSAKMRGNVAPLVSALSTEFAGE
jgi:GTP-binding protein